MYWKMKSTMFKYFRFPLASDSNFREDLIAWKTNNFDLAMKMKTKMEEA